MDRQGTHPLGSCKTNWLPAHTTWINNRSSSWKTQVGALECHCCLRPLLLATHTAFTWLQVGFHGAADPSGDLSCWGQSSSLRAPGCYGGWCPELQVGEVGGRLRQPESSPSQREGSGQRKGSSRAKPSPAHLPGPSCLLASSPPSSGWELQKHPNVLHLCHSRSQCRAWQNRWCHVHPTGGESPKIMIPVAVPSLASAIHLPCVFDSCSQQLALVTCQVILWLIVYS